MAAEIITKEGPNGFSEILLNDIKALSGKSPGDPPKWLKSYQVKNLFTGMLFDYSE